MFIFVNFLINVSVDTYHSFLQCDHEEYNSDWDQRVGHYVLNDITIIQTFLNKSVRFIWVTTNIQKYEIRAVI